MSRVDDALRLGPGLNPGEQILWKGSPNHKPLQRTRFTLWLPMLGMWLLIASTFIIPIMAFPDGWTVSFKNPSDIHWILFGLFIFLAIPGAASIDIFTTKKRAENTIYYITNQRIITHHGLVRVNEDSVFYNDISSVELQEGATNYKFGTKTIVINTRQSILRSTMHEIRNGKSTTYYNENIPRLKNISDYRHAYDLIRQYTDVLK